MTASERVMRSIAIGAAVLGAGGAAAGLVIGLMVYPPTVWFAIFELGIPAAVVGGILGACWAGLLLAWGKVHRPSKTSRSGGCP